MRGKEHDANGGNEEARWCEKQGTDMERTIRERTKKERGRNEEETKKERRRNEEGTKKERRRNEEGMKKEWRRIEEGLKKEWKSLKEWRTRTERGRTREYGAEKKEGHKGREKKYSCGPQAFTAPFAPFNTPGVM
jgi:hypothetical protein